MGRGYLAVKRIGANPSLLFFVLLLSASLWPIGSSFQVYCAQAAAVGIVVSLLVRWDVYAHRWIAVRSTPTAKILLALIAWMILQIVFQTGPARGTAVQWAECSRIISQAAAFTAVALLLRSTGTIRCARLWINTAAAAIAIVGIMSWIVGSNVRSEGFTGNPQILGAVLALFVPFALAQALSARPGRRTAFIVIACLIFISLLLTGTRSSCVAAATGSLIVLMLSPGGLKRFFPGRIPLAAMTLIAIGLFTLAPANKGLPHRLLMTSHDASVTDRISVWKTAVAVVRDHPFTGAGLGAFPLVASQYSHFWQLQTPAQIAVDGVGMTNLAHNEYLQIAADMGLPALLLFVSLLTSCGILLLKARNSTRSATHRSVLTASIGVLGVYSIDCLANPATHFPIVSILFWAMMGLGLAATLRHTQNPAVNSNRSFLPITLLLRTLQTPVTAAVFVLCLCGFLCNIGWAYPFSNLYFPGSVAPIASLLQSDSRWASNTYGLGSSTIAAKGGSITSLAMAMNGAGLNNAGVSWNPGSLNTFMQKNSSLLGGYAVGDFSGTSVDWAATVADARKLSTNTANAQWVEVDNSVNSFTGLDNLLTQGFPVIVNAQGNARTNSVLATGFNSATNHHMINDPETGADDLDKKYGFYFLQGYIRTATDLSELDVTVTESSLMQLTNPNGLTTGETYTTGGSHIPNSAFNYYTVVDQLTGSTASDFSTTIQVLQPTSGKYSVLFTNPYGVPGSNASYSGHVDGYGPDGTRLFDLPISGLVPYNQSATISFAYNIPEPSGTGLLLAGFAIVTGRRRQPLNRANRITCSH